MVLIHFLYKVVVFGKLCMFVKCLYIYIAITIADCKCHEKQIPNSLKYSKYPRARQLLKYVGVCIYTDFEIQISRSEISLISSTKHLTYLLFLEVYTLLNSMQLLL